MAKRCEQPAVAASAGQKFTAGRFTNRSVREVAYGENMKGVELA